MQSSTAQRLTLGIFLLLSVWLGFYVIQPPAPEPAGSSPTAFSAERAFDHVQAIAQQPHPLGSAANDSVRNYILEELSNLELNPSIQQGVSVAGGRGGRLAGYPQNIIAKIEGHNPEKTLLLMTHYDTAPNAPGAADDASGVAAILESVRALKTQDTPLKNDIIILITDGEERGLLGAELFVDQYEQLQQIDLVLNFEARGTSGPSMMFETSSPNANLIPHFAEATPHPVANSLMYTVYKLLPNDTDMSVTKRAGLKGLNFALTNEYLNYHTMQDSPENLSLASLQHHGSNLLGNVRHFGDTSFTLESSSEYVYFNSAGGGLAYYPASWSFPLAVISGLLFLAYLIYLFRTKRLTLGSYLGSLLLFLGIAITGTAITYWGWQGLKLLHPEYLWLYHGEVYTHSWYLWGFSALVMGLFATIYNWLQQKHLSMQQLLAGPLTIWMLLSLGTAWYLPTASYIFTWPALLALVGWIVLGDQLTKSSWSSTALLTASLFAVLFLLPPYIYLVQIMLTTQMLAVSMFLLILVLGLVWPLLSRIMNDHSMIWNGGFIAAALACFLIAAAGSNYDTAHKKQNDISYFQNLDSNQTYWISRDHTTDRWTRQFLGSNPQQGMPPEAHILQDGRYLYQAAKINSIERPTFTILSDTISDSLRIMSIDIRAHQRAIAMHIAWTAPSAIHQLQLDRKTFLPKKNKTQDRVLPNRISFFKNLSEPTELEIAIPKNEKMPKIIFTFLRMDLPTHLIEDYQPRDSNMMPTAHWNSNTTLWQVTVDPDTLE